VGTVYFCRDGQLIGASAAAVSVVGTRLTVRANAVGSFVLPAVPDSASRLRFEFPGYQAIELVVEPDSVVAVFGADAEWGITLSPSALVLLPQDDGQIVAAVRNCDGDVVPDPAVEWASESDHVAAVSSTGAVTGISPGTTTIRAAAKGQESTASVTVVPSSGPGDVIVIANNTVVDHLGDPDLLHPEYFEPEPETVVLVDAHAPLPADNLPCANDVVRPIDGLVFANLMPSDPAALPRGTGTACGPEFRDEIVVFSYDDRVEADTALGPTGTMWTIDTGESRTVDLGHGLLAVPMQIWLVLDNSNSNDVDLETRAVSDVATATEFFNFNRAGITLTADYDTLDVPPSGDWNALGLGYHESGSFFCPPAPPTAFEPTVLNVYYVPGIYDPVTGWQYEGYHCRTTGWNVIFMSQEDHFELVLAHELGHAFGLEHVGQDALPFYWGDDGTTALFDETNLMWVSSGASDVRTLLSLGQAFRISIEEISAINRNGLRDGFAGLQRMCECRYDATVAPTAAVCTTTGEFRAEGKQDGACPAVTKQWVGQ